MLKHWKDEMTVFNNENMILIQMKRLNTMLQLVNIQQIKKFNNDISKIGIDMIY